MRKAHKHASIKIMRRTSRIHLNDLNHGKTQTLREFLCLSHDVTQYFVDLFWQRKDFSATLADLATVHQGRDRFKITTRLSQALAKQAKECIRSTRKHQQRKPRLRKHLTPLCYHFVTIEPFAGNGFDYAIRLIGSGAPRIVIPLHSTNHLNQLLAKGWNLSRTIRLGQDRKGRLFVDLIVEKPRPALKAEGQIVGMDSNYKNGLVFSDGQTIGQGLYPRIQTFKRRQKHTHDEIRSLLAHALKHLDCTNIKVLCIENLKRVKRYKRGTFPRVFNRRLSHWLYAYLMDLLARHCEERGIRLECKCPAYTSQFCRYCRKWDRQNRVGDVFCCMHCGFTDHADHNAAKNLELLGMAGAYGLRSLLNSEQYSEKHSSG